MMTDRFDADLRQHLLETANERPVDGQLAAVVKTVAVTRQRHPFGVRLTWFPGRLGQFPAAVRYGLIAVVLVLAALAGAILAGGGGPPGTTFEGRWTATDPADRSTQTLLVGSGGSPTVRYEDDLASGGLCDLELSKHFTADGSGEIRGKRLDVAYPEGGSCGASKVPFPISGTYYEYDAETDTLIDYEGTRWIRAPGDGPVPTLLPEPSVFPSPSSSIRTVFEGRWSATDPADRSTLTLVVGRGRAPVVQFQDDLATGSGCVADEVKIFRADGVGEITGNRLEVIYPDGGGCGLLMVPIAGLYDYDAGTDTLVDPDGATWTRVQPGVDPLPSLRPAPSVGECIDLAQGGTYTGLTGPFTLTATVPGEPLIPWHGARDQFHLAGACGDRSPIKFFADTDGTLYETSCMPNSGDFTTFAKAIARLDTPAGPDISDRIDLTIDGHPAARYDIVNLATCPEGFGLWHLTSLGAGETGSVYVIDVDGELFTIELNRDGSQTAAELEETYAIIASLQISR